MRELIVDELCVGAPPERVAQARQVIQRPGNLALLLVECGFAPRDVLQACCAVTGLPPAPLAWLREPKAPSVAGLDFAVCRRVGAAPLAVHGERLCIVYGDPEVAVKAAVLPFPSHQAYLALPADVQRAIAALPSWDDDEIETRVNPMQRTLAALTARGREPAPGAVEPRGREQPPAGGGAAPGAPIEDADEDGATMISAPSHSEGDEDDEIDASEEAEAAAVAKGGGPLAAETGFDELTAAVAAFVPLPSVPKPARRQQAGIVSEAASSPEPTPPRARGAPAPGAAPSAPSASSASSAPSAPSAPPAPSAPAGAADVVPRSPAARRRFPSLATPSQGTAASPRPPASAEPSAGAIPLPGAAPPAASVSPTPTPTRAPAPPSALAVDAADPLDPAETLVTPGPPAFPDEADPPSRSATEQDAAPTLVTPQPPGEEIVPSPSPSPPPSLEVRPSPAAPPPRQQPAMDTHQQALAILSKDDLIEDDEPGDDVAAAPASPASPASSASSASSGSSASAPAESAQVASTDATEPARAPRPRPASASADGFVSAESLQGQEVMQAQQHRLKRIAQIASIKRYKVERVLGRGGMATVYFAVDTKTGSPCALKLMEPHLADDAVFVERFKREIRASTSLSHDNIVRVFDYGEEGGTYYMASEFVDGGTVGALLRQTDRPLPVALVVPMMMGFLDGLQHAHEQGFVHRDLKPANLMLTRTGVVKIGDFGIAKAQTDTALTKTGALFGTPAYMSPEQAQGQDLDARSDLFGVGIIFYELLAGYNPYAHENPSTTMFAIAKGQARALFDANPTVPEAVERVVTKLLERDRARRYQSAGEARDELRPLFELLREKYPDAVGLAVGDLERVVDELCRAQSVLESQRAGQLLQRSLPEHAEACFRYYKATLLDHHNVDAVNGLTQLRADYGFRFTRPDDRQMLELEQLLEKKAEQPAVLRRLADLSATHRNLVDMAGFMKRYLRLMPGDTHVQHKLERIIGTDPLAPFSMLPLELAGHTEQWSASEAMIETVRAASEDATASDSGPRGGIRPAARPRAAGATLRSPPPTAPGRRDGGPGQVPSTPAGDGSSTPRRMERPGAGDQGGPAASPTADVAVEEPARAPPRDSFAALLDAIRGFFEDTVRSLTGDQGLAAVKESLADRFGDSGGELKEVVKGVKGAIGKSKDVVAEGLLKAEGRQAIKRTVGDVIRQHWRLATLIVIAWLVVFALGKACTLACSDPPPRAAGRAVVDVAAIDRPAPSTTAAPATTLPPARPAAAADPPALSPADEARLLEGKPVAPARPAADPRQELAQRQEELKRKARAEPDPTRAVELYTEAVDIDPYAAGAREALLERARLHLAGGDLDLAEADLFRLKRRPDVDAVKAEVESMLADIAKAKEAATADP